MEEEIHRTPELCIEFRIYCLIRCDYEKYHQIDCQSSVY